MDAFEMLKNDHAEVATLFDKLEPATDAKTRQHLFAKLKQELEIHTHIEETILYPALQQAPETREITEEGYEEHQEVKDLLAELETTPADGEDWADILMELRENVEHHVEEEESEMFVHARTVLSEQQIKEIGKQMAAVKQQKQKAAAG